ncbi:MAG: outer membrane beta-barrel protein [Rhodanobacter sp.]
MPAPSTLSYAVALALAVASGTASAAQFDYSLFAGIEHSDNINLSGTDPVSQNVLSPGLNFTYSQQGSTIQANVAGTLEYFDYLGGAFNNQTFVQLSSQLNWTVLPQRLDFSVEDFAGVEPLSTLSSNAPDNQQQTNVLALGPILHFRLGDTLRGQAELHYINSYASKNKEFNSSRGEAALRVFKDLSPTDVLSANLEVQRVAFDDNSSDFNPLAGTSDDNLIAPINNPNYTRDEVFASYVRTLAHFNLNVALGWSQIDFNGAPTVSTPLERLTLGWQPTLRSSFSLTAAHEYSDAAQDMMVQPGQIIAGAGAQLDNNATGPVGPIGGAAAQGINVGGLVIDPQVYLDSRLEGNYTFNTERLTLSVSPLYSRLNYLNDSTFNQTDRGGSAGISYRLTPLVSLSTFVDYERLTYRSLDRRDNSSDYGLRLTDKRTPHWSWQVSLTHRQRDSTAPGQGYSENEIYFGVVFTR